MLSAPFVALVGQWLPGFLFVAAIRDFIPVMGRIVEPYLPGVPPQWVNVALVIILVLSSREALNIIAYDLTKLAIRLHLRAVGLRYKSPSSIMDDGHQITTHEKCWSWHLTTCSRVLASTAVAVQLIVFEDIAHIWIALGICVVGFFVWGAFESYLVLFRFVEGVLRQYLERNRSNPPRRRPSRQRKPLAHASQQAKG